MKYFPWLEAEHARAAKWYHDADGGRCPYCDGIACTCPDWPYETNDVVEAKEVDGKQESVDLRRGCSGGRP